MRLSDFYLQFRRQRNPAVEPSAGIPAPQRQTMTLEAMTRAAQTRSLKAALRQR